MALIDVPDEDLKDLREALVLAQGACNYAGSTAGSGGVWFQAAHRIDTLIQKIDSSGD